MSYRPDEQHLMAYLYGELEGPEKEKIEQYLEANPEARETLEQFSALRQMMGTVRDKEVIAPPIFVSDAPRTYFWHTRTFRTVASIAASLLLLLVAGRLTGTRLQYSDSTLTISFGTPAKAATPSATPIAAVPATVASVTSEEVKRMVEEAVAARDEQRQREWEASRIALTTSVRDNLKANEARMDAFMKEASTASQEQVRDYVATLQSGNMQMVKDYFKLTANEQKQYVETLLVDFAKYLQQQRTNDLQLMQTRLSSLEQNTSVFRQETEQILTNIISSVGGTTPKSTVKETTY